MGSKERSRKLREERKKQGLCYYCGGFKEEEFGKCLKCRTQYNARKREITKQRKEQGLCVQCGEKTEGKSRCEKCLDYFRERDNKEYHLRKENNLCTDCGKPAVEGMVKCEKCRYRQGDRHEYNTQSYNEAKKNNLCTSCGNPSDGCAKCPKCRKRSNDFRTNFRTIALNHYGNKCTCCGIDISEFIHFDHRDGGGHRHKKEIGCTLAEWIVKNNFPSNFQLLCSCCNKSKYRYGICPHIKPSEKPKNPLRLEAFDHYGGAKCNCCGETMYEFLEINHINGGRMRKEDPSHTNLARWLKMHNYPDGYEILCANCHNSVSSYGYCPHKKIYDNFIGDMNI